MAKEMENKGPQALNDEDLKNASGGIYHGGAWDEIYPPGDPRWKGLNKSDPKNFYRYGARRDLPED